MKQIFVEEILIKVNGQDAWLWVAYEPNLHVCLLFRLPAERTIFVCRHLFKQLRNRYRNNPIYTDGARWYNQACRRLRLKHIIYETKLRKIMESFIQ